MEKVFRDFAESEIRRSFFRDAGTGGFSVLGFKLFPDHHRYTQNDIDQDRGGCEIEGCESIVTTAKDAVKLAGLKFTFPCYVAEAEITSTIPTDFAISSFFLGGSFLSPQ